MDNISWKLEKRHISQLKDYDKNPRTIGKKQYELLKNNIKTYGLIDRPFINQDGTIIGGHVRTRILQELGYEEIDVFVSPVMLSDKQVEELCVKSNLLEGEWDDDILANQFDFSNLMEWGFEEKNLLVEENTRKRKTKPKFVIEFSNAADLIEFTEKHKKSMEDLIKEVKAKIRLMGVEYEN